jgi:hypothetical protein
LQALIIILINIFLVLVNILIHYETLYRLAGTLNSLRIAHRYRVLLGVMVIFLIHTIEIIIFALGYYLVFAMPSMGNMSGNSSGFISFIDCAYFSFVTYTTIGYGDIFVHGYARYITGIEALLGLILITWSASFLFIEMQKNWDLKSTVRK